MVLRTLQVEYPFTGKHLLTGAGGQAGASSTIAAILGSVSSENGVCAPGKAAIYWVPVHSVAQTGHLCMQAKFL